MGTLDGKQIDPLYNELMQKFSLNLNTQTEILPT